MTGEEAALVASILIEERAQLYASPERVQEIEQRQPEHLECGRSLLFFPEQGKRKRPKNGRRVETDSGVEGAVAPN